jgi:hypothetical protein
MDRLSDHRFLANQFRLCLHATLGAWHGSMSPRATARTARFRVPPARRESARRQRCGGYNRAIPISHCRARRGSAEAAAGSAAHPVRRLGPPCGWRPPRGRRHSVRPDFAWRCDRCGQRQLYGTGHWYVYSWPRKFQALSPTDRHHRANHRRRVRAVAGLVNHQIKHRRPQGATTGKGRNPFTLIVNKV